MFTFSHCQFLQIQDLFHSRKWNTAWRAIPKHERNPNANDALYLSQPRGQLRSAASMHEETRANKANSAQKMNIISPHGTFNLAATPVINRIKRMTNTTQGQIVENRKNFPFPFGVIPSRKLIINAHAISVNTILMIMRMAVSDLMLAVLNHLTFPPPPTLPLAVTVGASTSADAIMDYHSITQSSGLSLNLGGNRLNLSIDE